MSISEQPGGLYAEQEALVAVYRALGSLLPDGYDHIICSAGLVATGPNARISEGALIFRLVDAQGTVTGDGSSDIHEVLEALTVLRRVMYKPGIGTWWSVTVTVWANRRANAEFNYTDEPTIGFPPGGIAYLTDQWVFPIDEDKQPPWLKDRLADGVADLHKYGKKSYPLWLKRMIEAGKKPDWL